MKLAKRRELGTLKPHKAYRKFAGLLGAPAKPTKAEISIQLEGEYEDREYEIQPEYEAEGEEEQEEMEK